MGLTLLNPAQTYSVSNNFEARIPARQAQQRVIPMSQVGVQGYLAHKTPPPPRTTIGA